MIASPLASLTRKPIMSNLVSQEQKLRIVGQIMANLVTPHTAMEDLRHLGELANAGAEEACKAFARSANRGLGPMSTNHDRSHRRSKGKELK